MPETLEATQAERERLRRTLDAITEVVGLPRGASAEQVLGKVVNGLADTRAFAAALGLPETATTADVLIACTKR